MTAKKLTPIGIDNMKPKASRQEIPDSAMPGLYLVIQPTGAKSWAVRFQGKDGKSKKMTLGKYPEISIADAHHKATEIKLKLREGIDPHAEAIAAAAGEDTKSFEYIAAEFVKFHIQVKNKPTTQYEHTRLLNTELVSRWKGKQMADITLSDIRRLLTGKFESGKGTTTNRIHALISKLFRWATRSGRLAVNPFAAGMDKLAPENVRERYLTADEIRLVWAAAGRVGYPFGDVVKVLILTSQRLNEVARMEWTELDFKNNFYGPIFTVPPARAKNGVESIVPLADTALDIIKAAPKFIGNGMDEARYVFTHDGSLPVAGFTKNKKALDKHILTIMREEATKRGDDWKKVKPIPHWTLHDLRRTFSTVGPEELDVSQEVVDAIQNHKKKGMAANYNHAKYVRRKRAALGLWGQYVGLVSKGRKVKLVYRTPELVAAA